MSQDSFTLFGRTAVVTGAIGLLGRQHCKALGAAGARVVVTDIDDARCRDYAASLCANGIEAIGVAADVTEPADVERLCAEAVAFGGAIDVLVNNAAINDMVEAPALAAPASRFESYPLALFRRVMDVNVTGTFLCCQSVGAHMARRGRGSIINIASTYGIVAPDQSLYRDAEGRQRFYKSPAYPAAKGALLSLTRFLAAYFGANGVRVNALSPGGVENGQDPHFIEQYSRRTPLSRMAQPGDYQGALVFLASDASSYMTGANLVVDGGFTAW
jgi:NAD(P)-dependent dehydrogenase (short-subunit alcohol dehydrogenase family)